MLYIGEYFFPQPSDSWRKNETKNVKLYKASEDNELTPANDKNGQQLRVDVMNHIGTLSYKSPDARYCAVAKTNDTYFIMSTEC